MLRENHSYIKNRLLGTITAMKTPPVCDYEGSDYQEIFWENGDRSYEDAAEQIALRKVLKKGSGHLLELGAGAGRNTSRYEGYDHITLLDYSTTQLEQAKKRLGKSSTYRYVAADVYRLPFAPGIFSAATMIRTIHHLSQPEIAMEQIHHVLIDQAPFILEFANKRNIKSIIRYCIGKQKWNPFGHAPIEFVALNFDFHPDMIVKILSDNQFLIKKKVAVSHLRSALLKRILPFRTMTFFEKILQATASWATLSPSIFLQNITINPKTLSPNPFAFRCPKCGNFPIEEHPEKIQCRECSRSYPVINGIYDFRLKPED